MLGEPPPLSGRRRAGAPLPHGPLPVGSARWLRHLPDPYTGAWGAGGRQGCEAALNFSTPPGGGVELGGRGVGRGGFAYGLMPSMMVKAEGRATCMSARTHPTNATWPVSAKRSTRGEMTSWVRTPKNSRGHSPT